MTVVRDPLTANVRTADHKVWRRAEELRCKRLDAKPDRIHAADAVRSSESSSSLARLSEALLTGTSSHSSTGLFLVSALKVSGMFAEGAVLTVTLIKACRR